MRRIGCFSVAFIMVVVLIWPCYMEASGLKTGLGEVVIENLQIGQTYNLTKLANLKLVVTNTSYNTVDLQMDVLLPDLNQLRQEAEPLPDKSWVKLSQDLFKVDPNQKANTDIIISIPDDDQYLDKKYQFIIWSHTLGEGGMNMAVGLNSRIIFTTDKVKASHSESFNQSDASVDFTLKPEEIHLDNIELDKIYDLENNSGSILTITNPSMREKKFRILSQTVENSLATLTGGYSDAPDTSYLKFSENEFVLPAQGTRDISMFLKFPPNKEYSGKKYMFIIHAYTIDENISTGVYSRLYVSVK